jgi:hypothetical protein
MKAAAAQGAQAYLTRACKSWMRFDRESMAAFNADCISTAWLAERSCTDGGKC